MIYLFYAGLFVGILSNDYLDGYTCSEEKYVRSIFFGKLECKDNSGTDDKIQTKSE